jgi:pantothenate kinase
LLRVTIKIKNPDHNKKTKIAEYVVPKSRAATSIILLEGIFILYLFAETIKTKRILLIVYNINIREKGQK